MSSWPLQDPFLVSEQARIYRDWLSQREGCGILLFSLLSQSSQFSSAYQSLLDHVDGAVRLESDQGILVWGADFWSSPSGTVASRRFHAHIESNGTLTLSEPPENPTTGAIPVLDDQNFVFTTDATLTGLAEHDKANWSFSDNLVGLLHAARNAKGATIILTYDRNTVLRELAESAHTLRVALGRHVKIVVRERDASLRYGNELLLLRLGVNLIINREVPISRVPLTLESLQGQSFTRNVTIDFEAALASVMQSQALGYLQPHLFVGEAKEIIARHRALGVPFALVRLHYPPNMAEEEAIKRFPMTRAGDFMTATHSSLWIFLSSCPQSSLLPTLRRFGGESVENDFPDIEFYVQQTEVETQLDQLEHEAAQGGSESTSPMPAH